MKLDKRQLNQLHQALLQAFDRDGLRMMLRLQLNENLDAVAGDDPLATVVFDLLTWAERTDRLGDLVQGALAANPDNPALQQAAADFATWQADAEVKAQTAAATLLPAQRDATATALPDSATAGASAQRKSGPQGLPLGAAIVAAFALLVAAWFLLGPLLSGADPIAPTPIGPTLPALELTSTREPSPTATVELSPTATVEPSPTATVEPSPTATVEPSPTATSAAPRAPALRVGSQYTAFIEASRLLTIKSGESLELDQRQMWSAPQGTPVDCASGVIFFSWQVRQPYPGGEELEIRRLVPRGGGQTEVLAGGARGSANAGYCEQLTLHTLGLDDLRIEWRYVSALAKGAGNSSE